MDLRDYLRILRRRWMLIAGVVLVAVAASTVLTLRATPEYASTTRLFVSTPSSGDGDSFAGGQFSVQRVKSYADLLTGEEISRRVVQSLDLDESPRDLTDQISAEAVLDTVVLQITVTDPDPARAQILAAEVAKQFVAYVAEIETPSGQDAAPIKASVVDAATTPDSPVSPQPLRNLALGLLLGLAAGVGAAVLRETLDTSISSAEDLESVTDTAMLGAIPNERDLDDYPLLTMVSTHEPRAEAFRVLRTNLQFIDVDQDAAKVFALTSPLTGEGKTTTSTNLAIALAQGGQRVVLVDADLRRPQVAERMGLEDAVGLTTVLVGRVEVKDALQPWGDDGLQVLTAGTKPPNPAELLQSAAMDDVLTSLREIADVVVIDAPPLLPVTDATVVASKVDGAIVVIRHAKTTRDQLRTSVQRLESVNARLLGVVLNRTPLRGGDSAGYGYGYGYGYGFSAEDEAELAPDAERDAEPRKAGRRGGRRS